MKSFEVGKKYQVAGGGVIRIVKRTKCFITFEGDYSGRKTPFAYGEKGLFGLGEAMWLSKAVQREHGDASCPYIMQVLCTAGYEAE